MKLNELNNEELFRYMLLYNELNNNEKGQINFIIYKNHLMYLKENDIDKFKYYYTFLKDIINDKKLFYKENNIKINSISDLITNFNIVMSKEGNFFNNSLMLNSILIKNGLCPIVLYAFNNLIYTLPVDEKKIKQIVEFSLMYLYRVVKKELLCKDKGNLLDDTGAVSNIYINDNKVMKYPKTFASEKFLMKQEIDSYNYLKNTKLNQFLASNYIFDEKKLIIMHDYVKGKNGEYYLFNHMPFTKKQISSLKKFYSIYSKFFNEIILDIHPGNFIWDEEKKQWIIIDLGILPTIGKEYYEYDTFEDYFENIWIKREITMRTIPIRSLDLDFDLNVKDKEVKYE